MLQHKKKWGVPTAYKKPTFDKQSKTGSTNKVLILLLIIANNIPETPNILFDTYTHSKFLWECPAKGPGYTLQSFIGKTSKGFSLLSLIQVLTTIVHLMPKKQVPSPISYVFLLH
jgi:hypothetical protein